jgi:hypothetical protein
MKNTTKNECLKMKSLTHLMNINVEETKTVIVLSQSISEGFDNERLSSVAGTRVGMQSR